jgi:peptidoglycan DL-endopeptidase CwlO
VALVAAVPAFGIPPSISAKQAEARQVEQQINALDDSLGRADEMLNLANLKLARVGRQIAINKRELRVARSNLAKSRETIAKRLVTLYTKGQPSTLEVILGANSIDEILSRVDTENRVSSLDAQVIAQVRVFKASVTVHAQRLAVERRQVRRLVTLRRSQERAITVRLGERRRLLSSLNGEIRQLVAAQEAAQRAAQLRAAEEARSRYAQQQASQQQAYQSLAIGASGQVAEGPTVLPPSTHGGVVGIALSYLGTPYAWGGSSPGGFDCSGLVMYAYAQMGVSLPHSSYAMWDYGVPVPADQLQPGDLVFFNGLGHVGIYIGGGQYVESPHTGATVQVSSLGSDPSYVGARRIT